jgi:HK97 family phage prohead protease
MTSEESEMADEAVKTKEMTGFAKAVGERQVRVAASSAFQDRHRDIIRQEGMDLSNYQKNPVVLFGHDHDMPIAKVESIGLNNGRVEALVQFPPEGTSAKSDEVYRLIKAGIINAVSVGMRIKRFETMDDGGWDIIESELYELSFVSVPANADALVLERSFADSEKLVEDIRDANAAIDEVRDAVKGLVDEKEAEKAAAAEAEKERRAAMHRDVQKRARLRRVEQLRSTPLAG